MADRPIIFSGPYDGPFTYLFTCAICGHDVRDYPDRDGRQKNLEPLCRFCENNGRGIHLLSGDFMDRRIARQVSQLSDALMSAAYCQIWDGKHGKA